MKMTGLKDEMIRRYMKLKIKQVNELIDFRKFKASQYTDRSIAMHIVDAGDNIGFGFDPKTKKVVELKEIEHPTLLVKCSMKVFKALLAGKVDPDDLFYGNLVELEGEHILRDKIILSEMVGAFRKVGLLKEMKKRRRV